MDTHESATMATMAASTGTGAKRWGMVINLDRCIGCWTCAVACKSNNDVGEGLWWNRILTLGSGQMDVPVGEYPNLTLAYQPTSCMHCDNPPCVKVCPVSATFKREDGIVMIDYDRCIGCRYCMVACPYNVRQFNWETPTQIPANEGGGWLAGGVADPNATGYHVGDALKPPRPVGVVEKCDFCYQRVDAGEQPFCVEVCPARARFFGDLNDPSSEVSDLIRSQPTFRVLEELGTEPSVYYIPPRNPPAIQDPSLDPERRQLEGTPAPSAAAWAGQAPSVDRRAVARAGSKLEGE